MPRLVRRRSVDHRVCRAPTKRPAPRRRRPPIAASRAYFVLTVFFFGFLISLFWVFLPFAMISPRFHCRCGSGCFASCPTPTRHRVSLNEAVRCAAWYRPCGAAATPCVCRSPSITGRPRSSAAIRGCSLPPSVGQTGAALRQGIGRPASGHGCSCYVRQGPERSGVSRGRKDVGWMPWIGR